VPSAGYQVPTGGYQPPVLPTPTSPGGAPLAEFVDRLVARLIDGAILGGVTAVIIVPVYLVAFVALLPTVTVVNGQATAEADAFVSFFLPLFGVLALLFVLAVILAYIYEVEMMYKTGQTYGKRIMKIRIIALDPAAPLTRGLAAKRFLVQHGAGLVPGLSWVDGLWQLWDKPYQQCLHDKFATTVVIKLKP
jgi:uncharacterized RDD family membrane protein YckC